MYMCVFMAFLYGAIAISNLDAIRCHLRDIKKLLERLDGDER